MTLRLIASVFLAMIATVILPVRSAGQGTVDWPRATFFLTSSTNTT